MYAISYLKGTMLHWFEPNLTLDKIDLPVHTYVWQAFEEELKSTFSKPDPVASATQKLDNLSMKDSHHITKYNVKFNEYMTLTSFNNCALYAKFYKGLHQQKIIKLWELWRALEYSGVLWSPQSFIPFC